MQIRLIPLFVISMFLTLAGCSPSQETITPPTAAPAAVAPDQWLGQWTGPEGTFLRLDGGQGKYKVTIQNLDGPRTFEGSANGAAVQFERNGVRETIRATSGAETGMKWLSEKTHCLTVRAGEGYCRDLGQR